MKLETFLFINFVVSFMSDIVLNDLSNVFPRKHMIGSLQPYFENKSIVIAGIYAGLTILIATIIVSYISSTIYGFTVPNTVYDLTKYLLLAYIIGYFIDKLIEYGDVFGKSLHLFYRVTGSGHSGAIAFIFSLFISYIIQKYFLPLL
jgi:hypothetical protein